MYTQDENMAISQAYCEISADACVGSGQKRDDFQARICARYTQLFPDAGSKKRSPKNVTDQAATLKRVCKLYDSVYNRIVNSRPSGHDGDDVRRTVRIDIPKGHTKSKVFILSFH